MNGIQQQTTLKRCTQCKQDLPSTNEYFAAEKRVRSGLSARCRSCGNAATKRWAKENPDKAYAKTKQWRTEHPGMSAVQAKRWRTNNPEKARDAKKRYIEKYPDRHRATAKIWREKNSEKLRTQSRIRKQSNIDQIRAVAKHWREVNPNKKRESEQRRQAIKRSLPSTFTTLDWQAALNYFNGCCAYCGKPPSFFDTHAVLHQEHFKPLSEGGAYTPGNIIPACQRCNSSKKNTDPSVWATRHFGKRKGRIIIARILSFFCEVTVNDEE